MLPRFICTLALALAFTSVARAEAYVGVNGALTLPDGNAGMRHLGGATLRGGAYVSDLWALEGEAGLAEDFAALGVTALGHWAAWDLYDRFFGYSAFDPFVALGARGWLGGSRGQFGPKAGLGAFYHLDDRWSIRLDVDATLGLNGQVAFVPTLALGVQCSF